MKLFLAPCRFCGYNGEGFYQKHTHDKNCPFYEIGGRFEREIAISELMPQMYRRIAALEAENKALRDWCFKNILEEAGATTAGELLYVDNIDYLRVLLETDNHEEE